MTTYLAIIATVYVVTNVAWVLRMFFNDRHHEVLYRNWQTAVKSLDYEKERADKAERLLSSILEKK